MNIVHPAAKELVEMAENLDAKVGAGRTSAVLLAAEMLKQVKPFVEKGVHPDTVIDAIRNAIDLCLNQIDELAVSIDRSNKAVQRARLKTFAENAVDSCKELFPDMIVDALLQCNDFVPPNTISVKNVKAIGKNTTDSKIISGVAFKKAVAHWTFEPKTYANCKIAFIDIDLELKPERGYDAIERQNLNDKLAKIQNSGANVVLSKLPIVGVAVLYFLKHNMVYMGSVLEEDLNRTRDACGGAIKTTVDDLTDNDLGKCTSLKEQKISEDIFYIFEGKRED